jgi:hypothetical protein
VLRWARQPLSATLIDSTVRASLEFGSKHAIAAGLASATATTLARGVLLTMMISKLKIVGVAALICVLTVGGVHTLARQNGATKAAPPAVPKSSDGQDFLLQSVDKLDALLDDLDRRNRDLQTELRALRKEILSRRSAESTTVSNVAQIPAAERKGVDVRSLKRAKKVVNQAAKPLVGKLAGMGPGGMMGGMRSSNVEAGPAHFQNNALIVIVSPSGDKVASYNIQSGESRSLRLCDVAGTKQTVIPVFGNGVTALSVMGPKVARIAATTNSGSYDDGGWYHQDLREPVENATPMVRDSMAAYPLGRYI